MSFSILRVSGDRDENGSVFEDSTELLDSISGWNDLLLYISRENGILRIKYIEDRSDPSNVFDIETINPEFYPKLCSYIDVELSRNIDHCKRENLLKLKMLMHMQSNKYTYLELSY